MGRCRGPASVCPAQGQGRVLFCWFFFGYTATVQPPPNLSTRARMAPAPPRESPGGGLAHGCVERGHRSRGEATGWRWLDPPPAAREGTRPPPQPHTLSVLSAAPLGLQAVLPSPPFFLRRVSIQLALGRAAKPESARELRRMFLPDMMSSPKPSWWEKA